MVTKKEVEDLIRECERASSRNLKNRLASAIHRDYGGEDRWNQIEAKDQMNPRINGAYFNIRDLLYQQN